MDDVTYERMKKAVVAMQALLDKEQSLARVLFGKQQPRIGALPDFSDFFDESLNEPQKDAIRLALSAEDGTTRDCCCFD